ncbi:MAG: hypothetical protein JNL11_12995 [Bdellovibrionaceae bacterium]|nr:hypothetical protein [Pseudobdellovibrionaceae bacterium]
MYQFLRSIDTYIKEIVCNAFSICVTAVVFSFSSSLAASTNRVFVISNSIQTINIFTGAPQPIDGPSKYAGFGDIAANLVAATEIKARYPDRKVRLIVTTAYERIDPLIPTTDEIVKIMAPDLDPTKKGEVQMHGNVEVLFVPVDFHAALKINSKFSFYTELLKLSIRIPKHLPNADLSLNFSAYPSSAPVLRVNSKLSMSVEEHYGDFEMIQDFAGKGWQKRGAHMEVASGPYSSGFMLTHARPSREASIEIIRSWGKKEKNVVLPRGDFLPLIAYSAGWQSIQVYVDALAHVQLPNKDMVLFVKDFPEVKYENVPKSIKVIPVKGLPHEVMSAIIQESHFAPLVTGDISYGQGLSTVRNGKALIYESPEWKVDSAQGTKITIAKDMGVAESKLDSMFLLSEELEKMDMERLKQKSKQVAVFIGDSEFQTKISNAIKARYSRWDIIANTLKVAGHIIDKVGVRNLKSYSKESKKRDFKILLESEFNGNIPGCYRFYKATSI